MENYTVHYGSNKVGDIVAMQEGLYMHFRGQLFLPSDEIYRVYAAYQDKTVDAGIPIMEGRSFVLDTKIAVKKLGVGQPKFTAVALKNDSSLCYEIDTDKAFEHIAKLPNSILLKRGEKWCICVAKD